MAYTSKYTGGHIEEKLDEIFASKLQEKAVEIVDNGATEVSADEGFLGLSKVIVNTNVASSGGGGGTTPKINVNNYLTIEALEDGLTAKFNTSSTGVYEYCVDGDGQWKELARRTETEPIMTGQCMSFKCVPANIHSSGLGPLVVSKKYKVYGNIMSLLYGDNAADNKVVPDNGLRELFSDSTTLIDASQLLLLAETIGTTSYANMFIRCTNLVYPPAINVTKISGMNAFSNMFAYCSNLRVSPKLNTTPSGYEAFFNMFKGCSNLRLVETSFLTATGYDATKNWLTGVAEHGIIVKNPEATWDSTQVQIPQGWVVVE